MKRALKAIVSGVLLFFASYLAICWPLSMLLWMFVLGDSHEKTWKILPYIWIVICTGIAVTFVALDLMNKTSKRNRVLRLVSSITICVFVVALSIRGEAKRFKGWSSEQAALSVVSLLYPELADSLIPRIDTTEDVSSWTRGPNIKYTVFSDEEAVCRLEVSRKYRLYWTCGMSETLKDRKPNPEN